MRAEDKQLEGLDLERAEELQRQDVEEEELLEVGGEEVRDVALDHDRDRRGVLLGAIRAIFDRDTVLVSGLGLPQREEAALDSLQAAVSGRGSLGTFVYAEDRRDLLEQALAVLQPNLTHAEPELLAELGSLDTLTERLGLLRGELTNLEDAQEELTEWDKADWFEQGSGDAADTDDKPGVADAEADTSLDGPERAVEPKPSTVATGDDDDGDARPDAPPPASTLYDPAGDESDRRRATLKPPPEPPKPAPEPPKPRGGNRRG